MAWIFFIIFFIFKHWNRSHHHLVSRFNKNRTEEKNIWSSKPLTSITVEWITYSINRIWILFKIITPIQSNAAIYVFDEGKKIISSVRGGGSLSTSYLKWGLLRTSARVSDFIQKAELISFDEMSRNEGSPFRSLSGPTLLILFQHGYWRH
jgi:hypothetical protein